MGQNLFQMKYLQFWVPLNACQKVFECKALQLVDQ